MYKPKNEKSEEYQRIENNLEQWLKDFKEKPGSLEKTITAETLFKPVETSYKTESQNKRYNGRKDYTSVPVIPKKRK